MARLHIRTGRGAALGCAVVVAVLVGLALLLALAARLIRDSGLESRLESIRAPALVAAGVAALGWLGLLGALRWARRPREARPTAPSSAAGGELPELGPEPPAVAGMLANDFDPRRDAVTATLLDLAAQRVVEIEGLQDEARVRLLDEDGAGDHGLLPYERRVLELVQRRATDGAVPAAALTSGPREHARRWWREFRNEVIDDAQARGLSRDRWDRRTLSLASGAAFVPAVLALLATLEWGAAVAVLAGATVIVALIRERREQRDTDAGLEAAGRWLDVRGFLRAGAFADLPPASVAVWERYLAYAAAFGVATAAVEAIPMGAEEDRRAWSSAGGRWREVRIRYPFLWPPAWGWLPAVALGVSLVGVAVAAGMLRLATGIGWPQPGPGDPPGLIAFVRGIAVAAWSAGVVIGLWSVVTLVRSIADLGRTHRVTGQVLRLRTFGRSSDDPGRHYLAIDDGSADVIRAWRVPDSLWFSVPVSQYRTTTVTVWPHLGRVRSFGNG
jgi:hypothetical protein